MKTIIEEVKSASQVVGKPELPVFENLAESYPWFVANVDWARSDTPGVDKATGKVIDGEAYALFLVNTQNQTNIKNRIRSQFNQKPSQASLLTKAQEEFGALAGEQIMQIVAQPGGVNAWIKNRSEELAKEFEARKQAQIAANAANEASGQGSSEEETPSAGVKE